MIVPSGGGIPDTVFVHGDLTHHKYELPAGGGVLTGNPTNNSSSSNNSTDGNNSSNSDNKATHKRPHKEADRQDSDKQRQQVTCLRSAWH